MFSVSDHVEGGQPPCTTAPWPGRSPATRAHFTTSLAADFLSVADLEATLGAGRCHFAQVAVKELVDNALDAAEAADRLPEVTITAVGDDDQGTLTVTVTDNGPGIPDHVVAQVLDFDHRVSDKRRYQTPSRGQQGNALKGIVGIAAVLGGQPVVIEACGLRHHISARLVSAHVLPTHQQTPVPARAGTTVTLTVDAAFQQLDLPALAAGYALANPHITIMVLVDEAVSPAYRHRRRCDPLHADR